MGLKDGVVGGLVGFATGGPVGAFAGAAGGLMTDDGSQASGAAGASETLAQEQAAAGREKRKDYKDNYSEAERDFILGNMGYNPDEMRAYKSAITENAALTKSLEAFDKETKAGKLGYVQGTYLEGDQTIPGMVKKMVPFSDTEIRERSAQRQLLIDKQAALSGIKRPVARTGPDAETQAGLTELDRLSKVGQGYGQKVVDLADQKVDYWNVDQNILDRETGRAAETSQQQYDAQQADLTERMSAYGINPNSDRFAGSQRAAGLEAAGGRVSAINFAIDRTREGEYGRKLGDIDRQVQGYGVASNLNSADLNRYSTSFNAGQGEKLTRFNKGLASLNLAKGNETQGLNLLGAAQVGMGNVAGLYSKQSNDRNQMLGDIAGAGLQLYSANKMNQPSYNPSSSAKNNTGINPNYSMTPNSTSNFQFKG